MDNIKRLFMVGALLFLASCGTDGVPMSGSQTHRGEADGTNPVRGVTISNFCLNNAGDKNVDVTINNTNNCTKNNDNSSSTGGEG